MTSYDPSPSQKLQKLKPALTDFSPIEQLWLLELLIQQLRQILPTSLSNPIGIPTPPTSPAEYAQN